MDCEFCCSNKTHISWSIRKESLMWSHYIHPLALKKDGINGGKNQWYLNYTHFVLTACVWTPETENAFHLTNWSPMVLFSQSYWSREYCRSEAKSHFQNVLTMLYFYLCVYLYSTFLQKHFEIAISTLFLIMFSTKKLQESVYIIHFSHLLMPTIYKTSC